MNKPRAIGRPNKRACKIDSVATLFIKESSNLATCFPISVYQTFVPHLQTFHIMYHHLKLCRMYSRGPPAAVYKLLVCSQQVLFYITAASFSSPYLVTSWLNMLLRSTSKGEVAAFQYLYIKLSYHIFKLFT